WVAILGDASGHICRSTDYGATWTDLGVIASGYIFSMAYLGNGIAILGDADAHVYRSTSAFQLSNFNPDQYYGAHLGQKHHTADATLSAALSNTLHTNLGATGDITLTLPQNPSAGCYFHFTVMAAHQLRIDPGAAGGIYINGAKQTDNKYIWAADEGASVMLIADGNGDWAALYSVGTWGVEG
ncbi:unnamed protein product, partial [marine sediment metagenome]